MMRKKGNYNLKLLDSVLSDYNLDKSIKQVVKNKGTNGVD